MQPRDRSRFRRRDRAKRETHESSSTGDTCHVPSAESGPQWHIFFSGPTHILSPSSGLEFASGRPLTPAGAAGSRSGSEISAKRAFRALSQSPHSRHRAATGDGDRPEVGTKLESRALWCWSNYRSLLSSAALPAPCVFSPFLSTMEREGEKVSGKFSWKEQIFVLALVRRVFRSEVRDAPGYDRCDEVTLARDDKRMSSSDAECKVYVAGFCCCSTTFELTRKSQLITRFDFDETRLDTKCFLTEITWSLVKSVENRFFKLRITHFVSRMPAEI